jgi:hypothetical protein
MNEPNTNPLYSDFPQLYCQRYLTVEESAMPWGFQCRDGWFDIIYELSEKLNSESRDIELETVQVKQKFGHLIFQVNLDHKAIEHCLLPFIMHNVLLNGSRAFLRLSSGGPSFLGRNELQQLIIRFREYQDSSSCRTIFALFQGC